MAEVRRRRVSGALCTVQPGLEGGDGSKQAAVAPRRTTAAENGPFPTSSVQQLDIKLKPTTLSFATSGAYILHLILEIVPKSSTISLAGEQTSSYPPPSPISRVVQPNGCLPRWYPRLTLRCSSLCRDRHGASESQNSNGTTPFRPPLYDLRNHRRCRRSRTPTMAWPLLSRSNTRKASSSSRRP